MGKKLIIALNLCDLLICFVSLALLPISIISWHDKLNLVKSIVSLNDTENVAKEIEILAERIRVYISSCRVWKMVLYVPLNFLVQQSCFLTVLLSATRMVAMVKPLCVIKTRFIKRAFFTSSVLFLCIAIGKWILFYLGYEIDISDDMIRKDIGTFNHTTDFDLFFIITKKSHPWYIMAQIQMAESFSVVAMVVIVAVFSAITIKSLNSPIVEVMEPGGVKDNSQNRRAVIMVLLLSLAFVLMNTVWVVMFIQFYGRFLLHSLTGQDPGIITMVTLAVMSASSLVNPLIYIARNSELHEYTRNILTTPVLGLLWMLRSSRSVVTWM